MTKKKEKVARGDANRCLYFQITPDDVCGAVRYDPENCVVARAVRSGLPGVLAIYVGARMTVVTTANPKDGRTLKTRYQTPGVLRNGLNTFDKTGEWRLPEGQYKLSPPRPMERLGMWHNYPKKRATPGTGERPPSGRKAVPLNPRYLAFFQKKQVMVPVEKK